jgi:hypothetical protein
MLYTARRPCAMFAMRWGAHPLVALTDGVTQRTHRGNTRAAAGAAAVRSLGLTPYQRNGDAHRFAPLMRQLQNQDHQYCQGMLKPDAAKSNPTILPGDVEARRCKINAYRTARGC